MTTAAKPSRRRDRPPLLPAKRGKTHKDGGDYKAVAGQFLDDTYDFKDDKLTGGPGRDRAANEPVNEIRAYRNLFAG